MHDPFLKSVFRHRRMVEILIRRHVPEWADEIDPATLREEPNELVSRKTLQQRYPDLIWSAKTLGGKRLLFLIEFQRRSEALMALRTTTYTSLALEGVAGAEDFAAGDPLPEFVYLVLYHGDGPWKAPTQVTDLFQRSNPGAYRLVAWREWAERVEETGAPPDDLVALVLGLARSISARDMAAQLTALRLAIKEREDPELEEMMAERVDTMLQLRNYPAELTEVGAVKMTEVVDRFQESLDELVQEGARKGEARVLRRQTARRFGEDTAVQLSKLLDELPSPDRIDQVTDALFDSGTGEEFIERVRTA